LNYTTATKFQQKNTGLSTVLKIGNGWVYVGGEENGKKVQKMAKNVSLHEI
jgi:hypothetical protein